MTIPATAAILADQTERHPVDTLEAVATREEFLRLISITQSPSM